MSTMPSPDEIIDLSIPPLSDGDSRFVNTQTGDFDTSAYTEHMYEQTGTAGAIAVALSKLQYVQDELSGADTTVPTATELAFLNTLLSEATETLVFAADTHIESYDEPLYDVEDSPSADVEENESSTDEEDGENSEWNPIYTEDQFTEVTVDRISGSGNLIAESPSINPAHIHITHGTVDKDVIVFLESGNFTDASGGSPRAKTVPYESIEAAVANYSPHESLRLREGDTVKFERPTPSEANVEWLAVDRFDTETIDIGRDVSELRRVTVEIESISGQHAKGTPVDTLIEEAYQRKQEQKKKKRKQRRKRRKKKMKKGQGSKRNTTSSFGNPLSSGKNLNKLLKGYR